MADWEDAPGKWEEAPSKGGRQPYGDPERERNFQEWRASEQAKFKAKREAMGDPTLSMSGMDRFRAGMGSSFAKMGRGIGQRLGMVSEQDVEEARKRDQPLGDTAGGALGQFVGEAAPLAGASVLAPGANTIVGSGVMGAARGAIEPTAPGESVLKNAAMGAATGAGATAVVKGVGKGISTLADRSTASGAAAASRNQVMDETLKRARAEGYVVPPSATGGGMATNALESVGGKAALGQEASRRNQQITNKIARREAGLGENDPLSVDSLKAARERMAEPYREVTASSPRAASALDRLKESRLDASDNWRKYFMDGDPKFRKEAVRLDSQNSMLEAVIDKEAKRSGSPDLLQRLREARRSIAKNHDVEKAVNVGGGDVDATIIGRMLDRGKPLSEGLETIGRFAERFGQYAKESSKTPAPGVSKLGAYMSGLLGLGGHAAMGPGGVALAAAPLVGSPAARSVALSNLMQKPVSYGPGAALRLSDLVANNARVQQGIPLSALAIMNAQQQ